MPNKDWTKKHAELNKMLSHCMNSDPFVLFQLFMKL